MSPNRVFCPLLQVVHVPVFTQRRDVREFTEAVVAAHGIYRHRWGDAPLRYLALHLFLDAPAKKSTTFVTLPTPTTTCRATAPAAARGGMRRSGRRTRTIAT